MDDRRLKELLRAAPLPDEAGARERGWRVVRAAFVGRERLPREARRPRRLAIAVAGAAGVLAIVLTPAGAKVADVFRDVTGIGAHKAEPALRSLPAPGRILVGSGEGIWVVDGDGSKRLLSGYRAATWSPRGLFVATAGEHQLAAVEPSTGVVHWTLARPRVADPAWSPSGYRIAYRSRDALRLVVGDGTGDRLLAADTAAVTPAWRPLSRTGRLVTEKGAEPPERLAYVDGTGRIHVVDTTNGTEAWQSSPGPVPRDVLWTTDGSRLVAAYRDELRVFSAGGRLERRIPLPAGTRLVADAVGPGDTLAIATVAPGPRGGIRGQVESLDVAGTAKARPLFSGPGRFTGLAFAPNGRWLLVAWQDADQWLFVPLGGGRVKAVGRISQQFAPGATGSMPFPRVDGWCCSR